MLKELGIRTGSEINLIARPNLEWMRRNGMPACWGTTHIYYQAQIYPIRTEQYSVMVETTRKEKVKVIPERSRPLEYLRFFVDMFGRKPDMLLDTGQEMMFFRFTERDDQVTHYTTPDNEIGPVNVEVHEVSRYLTKAIAYLFYPQRVEENRILWVPVRRDPTLRLLHRINRFDRCFHRWTDRPVINYVKKLADGSLVEENFAIIH